MPSDFFDLERIRRESFVPKVEWHATLDSTNDRALQLASSHSIDTPLLILADEQTAGRGRGNNRWWSGEGALILSLVLDPLRVAGLSLRADHWPRVALSAGVALCEALARLAPQFEYGLKWPNDILFSGKKVAGILAEIPPARPPVPRRMVLGMGVNVNNSFAGAPDEIRERGISLCDAAGRQFDRTSLLLSWLERFADTLHALANDDPRLPARWQSRCVLTGKSIELQAGERIVQGACRGIDTDGALLLDTPAGPERLYGGVLVRLSR